MAGRYQVRRNFSVGGGRRVLLYSWGLETASRIRNLVCVDADDAVVWKAELPPSTDPDCFVSVEPEGDALTARTYQGHQLTICVQTGGTLT